mmetsp:Transcript_22779/g.45482  ORF Transcript_22779/g.45482 Transcript_22779/m.45482 type:complete len:568 (+) Transcript_22779:85-1788(+)
MIDIVQPASMASNPIEQDEFSTHELNVTTLSLPESFDDVCTDLYKLESSASPLRKKNWTDLITPATKHTISTPKSDITPTNDGLEARIRELYAENLELKEKGRMYDAIKRRSLQSEAEIKSLQRQLEEKTSEYETSLMHENEYKHQTLEFKKKVQLLALDLDHAKKDAEQLLNRAEKSEKEHEATLSELQLTKKQNEDEIVRLTKECRDIKSSSEHDIARVREECKHEIATSKSTQQETFSRESKLLQEARDNAIEQSKILKHELLRLVDEKEAKDSGHAEVIKELERQLSDARSALKVKSCEFNSLRASKEKISAEATFYRKEIDRVKEDLVHSQKRYNELERNLANEIFKLEETVRRKDESLEIYSHDDSLFFFLSNDRNNDTTSRRKSLLKNSVSLAKTCRDLQSMITKLNGDLAEERERNNRLSGKVECSQRLLNQLASKNKSCAYIISTMIERDREIKELHSQVQALRVQLSETQHDRDQISSDLTRVLERREQLKVIKKLIESIKYSTTMASSGADDHSGCSHQNQHSNGKQDDDDEIQDHLVHRGKHHNSCTVQSTEHIT